MAHIPGMIRAMAAVPRVHLADPQANAQEILALLRQADEQRAELCVFPELCLCGYTCADLFFQTKLLTDAVCKRLKCCSARRCARRSSSGFRWKSAAGCITARRRSAAGGFSAWCPRRICQTAASFMKSAGLSRELPRRRA